MLQLLYSQRYLIYFGRFLTIGYNFTFLSSIGLQKALFFVLQSKLRNKLMSLFYFLFLHSDLL